MPSHVHLIFVPPSTQAMTTAIADIHRRYSFVVNRRHRWRGNLCQGRFGSYATGEPYALSASALRRAQPVRGANGAQAEDWPGPAPARNSASPQRPRASRHC